MQNYFFIYKKTLKSGNTFYYYQIYNSDGTFTPEKARAVKQEEQQFHIFQIKSFRCLDDAKIILNECKWVNQSQRLFNFVAALTGLRLSEINALHKDNIKPNYIDLRDQYLRGALRPLKTINNFHIY